MKHFQILFYTTYFQHTKHKSEKKPKPKTAYAFANCISSLQLHVSRQYTESDVDGHSFASQRSSQVKLSILSNLHKFQE